MACCAVGAAITAAVVWIVRAVRTRVFQRAERAEAASWRLQP